MSWVCCPNGETGLETKSCECFTMPPGRKSVADCLPLGQTYVPVCPTDRMDLLVGTQWGAGTVVIQEKRRQPIDGDRVEGRKCEEPSIHVALYPAAAAV